MDYTEAAKVMEEVHLRRDWSLHWFPSDDNTMLVEIRGLVDNSSAFPKYEAKSIANGNFIIRLRDITYATELLRIVLDNLIMMAIHEEREFLRYGPNWSAPFHPHTTLGQELWKATQDDAVGRAVAAINTNQH